MLGLIVWRTGELYVMVRAFLALMGVRSYNELYWNNDGVTTLAFEDDMHNDDDVI